MGHSFPEIGHSLPRNKCPMTPLSRKRCPWDTHYYKWVSQGHLHHETRIPSTPGLGDCAGSCAESGPSIATSLPLHQTTLFRATTSSQKIRFNQCEIYLFWPTYVVPQLPPKRQQQMLILKWVHTVFPFLYFKAWAKEIKGKLEINALHGTD